VINFHTSESRLILESKKFLEAILTRVNKVLAAVANFFVSLLNLAFLSIYIVTRCTKEIRLYVFGKKTIPRAQTNSSFTFWVSRATYCAAPHVSQLGHNWIDVVRVAFLCRTAFSRVRDDARRPPSVTSPKHTKISVNKKRKKRCVHFHKSPISGLFFSGLNRPVLRRITFLSSNFRLRLSQNEVARALIYGPQRAPAAPQLNCPFLAAHAALWSHSRDSRHHARSRNTNDLIRIFTLEITAN